MFIPSNYMLAQASSIYPVELFGLEAQSHAKAKGAGCCWILQESATKTHCIHSTLRPTAIGNTTAGATALAVASFSTGVVVAVAGSWQQVDKMHTLLEVPYLVLEL